MTAGLRAGRIFSGSIAPVEARNDALRPVLFVDADDNM
jgi:hypothetical protein